MKKFTPILLALALASCATNHKIISQNQNAKSTQIEPVISPEEESTRLMVFSAIGEGIPPINTVSQAQALALAKRAAMADAYRQLASKLYGIRVNSRENVKDAMLRSSLITTYVNGLIKNANITGESFKDGLYTVELELKIDKYAWNELFAY